MYEHIRILSAILNLIIGAGILVYLFQLQSSYTPEILRTLFYYVVIFNVLIFSYLIFKYLDLNIRIFPPSESPHTNLPLLGLLTFVLFTGLSYFLLKFIFIFQGIKFKNKINHLFITILGILIILYSFRWIIPDTIISSNSKIEIQVIVLILPIIGELFISLSMIFVRCKEKQQSKILKTFGALLLTRYFILFLMIAISLWIFSNNLTDLAEAILISATLIYFNIVPFLWIKHFYIKYIKETLVLKLQSFNIEEIQKQYDLTKREVEILEFILLGKSNKEIEELLFISYHTVKNHISNLYQKLNVKNRYQTIALFTK